MITHQDSWLTRLKDYIAEVLPWTHGHQLKGITTFVGAILEKQTGNQAELARGQGNQEAALKRLSRLLHNTRLGPHRLADSVLAQALEQLPPKGTVRLAIDWTIEGVEIPASTLVYEEGDDGALAWVFEYSVDGPNGNFTLVSKGSRGSPARRKGNQRRR